MQARAHCSSRQEISQIWRWYVAKTCLGRTGLGGRGVRALPCSARQAAASCHKTVRWKLYQQQSPAWPYPSASAKSGSLQFETFGEHNCAAGTTSWDGCVAPPSWALLHTPASTGSSNFRPLEGPAINALPALNLGLLDFVHTESLQPPPLEPFLSAGHSALHCHSGMRLPSVVGGPRGPRPWGGPGGHELPNSLSPAPFLGPPGLCRSS